MRRLLLLALMLPACTAVGPDYAGPPPAGRTDAFSSLAAPSSARGATRAAAVPVGDLSEWYRSFSDPVLDGLVARGIAGSPEIRLAAARVAEAQALGTNARAAVYPTLDASGSYSRQRQAARSPGNVQFPPIPGVGAIPPSPGAPGTEFDRFEGGLQASWELDLFGSVRRGVEASEADLAAAEEAGRDALVSLLAETARTYFELRALQRRTDIARESLALQRRTAALTRERRSAGLASELDVVRLDGQVASTAARLPELAAAEREAMHALSVLVGQPPGALAGELAPPRSRTAPRLPAEIPVGAPDDLLRRRPDIRQSERQLAAATARIGVATAELFPRVGLNGSLGRAGFTFGDLGGPANTFFSFVLPEIRWRIFDGGRVRADIAANRARAEAAAARYEATVLRAQREAEDALSRLAREQDRRAALAAAVAANRRAADLARSQYGSGLTALVEVLDAERERRTAEDELARSEAAVVAAVVATYRALGGGWR